MNAIFEKRISTIHKTLTREKIIQFSNFEPRRKPSIHIDREAAEKAGFSDIIAEAIMLLAYLSELLTSHFGVGWIKGGKLSVNFIRAVFPGDRLNVQGVVKDEMIEGNYRRQCLKIWCENQKGEKVVVGTASGLIA